MISTTNLGKSYGPRTLFENVSLQLNAGARYGLVGANGSGKTTLLRILAGDEEASEGTLRMQKNARLGVLRQDRFLEDEVAIVELAMRGDATVWNAMSEQKRLAAEAHPDSARIGDLEDVIAAHDGYTLKARASEVLVGLGIETAAHERPLGTLSGGFKLRVLLAQVLVGGADILLLDEPTNHLDILTIRWLEKFLAAYSGCAVIISHDQRFLDNVATHTLDVDYQTITLYTGNFSAFTVEKAAVRARKEAEVTRAEEEIARKRSFVDRFGAKATKASQAQSRLKQIEKIEVEELVESSRRTPHFRFVPRRPSGREVLTLEHVSRSYGEKHVLTDVSVIVRRGERLAVIGPNGLGKSTLLKVAVETLAPDEGTVRWGHETHLGYFPQDHREVLDDPATTPLALMEDACPGESPSFVRGQLGRVLFSAEEVDKKVGSLSGGEAARLIFGLLAVRQPNVLLLDEPTNHLDMESIHGLSEALKTYQGTVVFVSHDRWFVSQLATRIIELTPGGPRDFPGTYAEYLERCGDDHLDADAVVLKARRARQPVANDTSGWEERKKRRNRLNKLPAERDRVLKQVEAAEARKQAIIALFFADGFYQRTPAGEIAALEREQSELGPRIEGLMAQWEELERQLEVLAREEKEAGD